MRQRVFNVRPDHEGVPDVWFLDEPRDACGNQLDAREFSEGLKYVGPDPLEVPIYKPGKHCAFNFAAFDMPVVRRDIARIIEQLAPHDTELYPVTVSGEREAWFIVNVVTVLDCLDESRSEIARWQERDNRPDRLGQIHAVYTICVDPARVANHHLFRIKGWPFPLLMSSTLKTALQEVPDLGVVFKPAS